MDEGTVAISNIPLQPISSLQKIDLSLILTLAYLCISLILSFRFFISLASLFKACKGSEIIRYNNMTLFVSEKHHHPFSFFRFTFISRSDFENENARLIMIHEQAHLDCLHSFDLFFLEILQFLFWINPMIVMYRRALQLQHEYQVDKIVLQKTNDYPGYLYCLAKVGSNGLYKGISNGFYCSTLKKRIQMIGNKTSKKVAAMGYLILFPMVLIMIFAFMRPGTSKFFEIIVPLHIIQTEPNDVPSIVPIDENKAKYTYGWGNRIHPIYKIKLFHLRADWTAPAGTEVFATADGKVEKVESTESGYGKEIIIRHTNNLSTRYAHLSGFAVKSGEEVKKGQIIGYVGSSGRSTAPHLHYEVLLNGKAVDPGNYYKLAVRQKNVETFD